MDIRWFERGFDRLGTRTEHRKGSGSGISWYRGSLAIVARRPLFLVPGLRNFPPIAFDIHLKDDGIMHQAVDGGHDGELVRQLTTIRLA